MHPERSREYNGCFPHNEEIGPLISSTSKYSFSKANRFYSLQDL